MDPVERVIRRLDATQQRFPPAAFVFGVVKKFGDDNGGALVSNLAYSGFVSLFPLLLLVTILGLAASTDAGFRHEILTAVANQVPLIGRQLTEKIHVLRRSSVIGLIVGLAGLIWGASGLARAGLFTMEQVWTRARDENRWGVVHAFPAVTDAPSNALCRSLGFRLAGEVETLFAGRTLRTNHWFIDPRTDLG